MSLPGADELFRTTGGMALQSSSPRRGAGGDDPSEEAATPGQGAAASSSASSSAAGGVVGGAVGGSVPASLSASASAPPTVAATAGAAQADPVVGAPRRPQEGSGPAAGAPRRKGRGANRRPSGRERHDEKITVYVSAEELMDLEHARLVLRGEHGLAVDRGRIVREAVAVVLADLESRGDASILVRRLRGR
ncbi:hypothetical protein [Streptomyces sp. NPDC051211]|uniref:hypothetical protein n=1 Tax=Streptomyces sp. NPDC051211 TaxID=3154643 RepID=UPI00344DE95C